PPLSSISTKSLSYRPETGAAHATLAPGNTIWNAPALAPRAAVLRKARRFMIGSLELIRRVQERSAHERQRVCRSIEGLLWRGREQQALRSFLACRRTVARQVRHPARTVELQAGE